MRDGLHLQHSGPPPPWLEPWPFLCLQRPSNTTLVGLGLSAASISHYKPLKKEDLSKHETLLATKRCLTLRRLSRQSAAA